MKFSETKEEIKRKLKEVVDEKRYRHSLLAAAEARRLAERYGIDAEKAETAGLVHDIAKRFSAEENRYFVEKYGLELRLLDEEYKNVVHAEVGAAAAKEWFGLDEEICRAVARHTIPDEKMTEFDKVVFLADKFGREELSEEMQRIREVTDENLDAGMTEFLKLRAEDLKRRGIKLREKR